MLQDLLTPERWQAAITVLSGQSDCAVSKTEAAKAAGVSVQVLASWIRRSEERRPGDEPWIWNIIKEVDECPGKQIGRLEDVMWKRAIQGEETDIYFQGAVVGTKTLKDNKLLMSLLRARDDRYKTNHRELASAHMEPEELHNRLKAYLKQKAAKSAIEGELVPVQIENSTTEESS